MRIDRLRALPRCDRGHAAIEFVFIVPLLLVVFFLGYNATLALRDRTELIGTLRTAVSAGNAGGAPACAALAARAFDPAEAGARSVTCLPPMEAAGEESVAETPFWDDALDAASGGLISGRMGEDMIEAVRPDPVLLIRGQARQTRSPHAEKIGVRRAVPGAEGYVLPDPALWTHADDPLSQGYDRIIKDDLNVLLTGKLFPNVYTKAE